MLILCDCILCKWTSAFAVDFDHMICVKRQAVELQVDLTILNTKNCILSPRICLELTIGLISTIGALFPPGFTSITHILTVTPTYALPMVTETPVPESTSTPSPPKPTMAVITATDIAPAVTPVKTPANGVPFCGGTALFLPLLAGLLWAFSRRR